MTHRPKSSKMRAKAKNKQNHRKRQLTKMIEIDYQGKNARNYQK